MHVRAQNHCFELEVEIPRMRIGNKQTIETLINEEALLFAKYLRAEIGDWAPRSCSLAGANNRR